MDKLEVLNLQVKNCKLRSTVMAVDAGLPLSIVPPGWAAEWRGQG